MSVTLAIFTYPGANECMNRHYPYFLNQQADRIYGIGTTDGGCQWPEGRGPGSCLDGADGFPRYFFGSEAEVKAQMETWVSRRGECRP